MLSEAKHLLRFFATLRFAQNDIHNFSTFARSLMARLLRSIARRDGAERPPKAIALIFFKLDTIERDR
ncbi:hypothetical protein [Mastigocladopsis repens]|uniref:hypothetical protein n=1 Tax=Mastigocladopsis repens TaxID=221287 RepID=UPI0002FF1DBF|nr:hypothetical protein [Mastigocladopsis repens]